MSTLRPALAWCVDDDTDFEDLCTQCYRSIPTRYAYAICAEFPSRFCTTCVEPGDIIMELECRGLTVHIVDPAFLEWIAREASGIPVRGMSVEPWFWELRAEYTLTKI